MPQRHEDDDHDEYDGEPRRPRRRNRSRKSSESTILLIIGGVILGGILFLGIGGYFVYKALNRNVARNAINGAANNPAVIPPQTATDNPQPQAPVTVKFNLSNIRREPHPTFPTKMLLGVDYEYTAGDPFVPSKYKLCIKSRSGVNRVGLNSGFGSRGPRDTILIEQFGFGGDQFKGSIEVWVEESSGEIGTGKRVSDVITASF